MIRLEDIPATTYGCSDPSCGYAWQATTMPPAFMPAKCQRCMVGDWIVLDDAELDRRRRKRKQAAEAVKRKARATT
jgi:hypothetical protein